MNESLRHQIYKQIDEKGIYGRFMDNISIFQFDINSGQEIKSNGFRTFFQVSLPTFGISDSEANQVTIDYLQETFGVNIESVDELVKLTSLNKKAFILQIYSNETTFFIVKKRVPGSITFRENFDIDSLGIIEEIIGDLGFTNSTVSDLGDLKKVTGDFWIVNSEKILSLNNVEYVGGNLNLKKSAVTDLGNLSFVGANLNLRGLPPIQIQKTIHIQQNLLLNKKHKGIYDLEKFKVIGSIKYFND